MTRQPVMIRAATPADVPAIVDLYTALSHEDAKQRDPSASMTWAGEHGIEHFTNRVTAPTSQCFIAESDGTPIGYLAATLAGPSSFRPIRVAELENMFVQPEWRGRHVGAQLFHAFAQWATAQEASRLRVTAYATNQPAIAFYQRMGFAPHQLTLERPIT